MNDLIRTTKANAPVECLGKTFPSEDARREHFLKLLAEKLKDPAFRNQEGFPQGTDDAILAMSDPRSRPRLESDHLPLLARRLDLVSLVEMSLARNADR